MSPDVRQILRFVKLTPHAKAPTKGSQLAAGFDLYSQDWKLIQPEESRSSVYGIFGFEVFRPENRYKKNVNCHEHGVKRNPKTSWQEIKSAYDYVVPSMGQALALTDIQIQVPHGFYGRVAPRSGLAVKNFIHVGAGVVDEDYRGNVGVVLFNFGPNEFKVAKGDRIAQLICEKICYPDIKEVEKLEDTDRGDGGFGSTGMN